MLNSAKIIPAVQQFKESALFLKKTGGGGGGGGGGGAPLDPPLALLYLFRTLIKRTN